MIDLKTSIHYIPKETLEQKNLFCILHYNTIRGKNSEKKKMQYYQAFHNLKVQDNKRMEKKNPAILQILHLRFKPNQERGKMTIMKNG